MSKSMVVVESPAKAKTIAKYLGDDYVVKASSGHIKDLPKNGLGVDLKNNFDPTYQIIPGKERVVNELKKAARGSPKIYLAADPDREGEAICQHLAEELGGKGREIYRVLFNEITRSAILEAFKTPGRIDSNKVDAQQARRILDRLVGYKVSPLLWEKVRRGLSAGRVQTVALRMIVEREKEIRAFIKEEYWNIAASLKGLVPPPFEAKLVEYDGQKKVPDQATSDQILAELRAAKFRVASVAEREKKRYPVPPFITSKLQQEGVRKLRFSVKKTMMVAQRLYEGIELGREGLVGLITYMRTDSTRVAQQALEEARQVVSERFGSQYLPDAAIVYKSKKGAQDAHEAIRPTSAARTPEQIKKFLGADEFKLYDLIWERFIASQMKPAVFDQTDIEIEAGKARLKASGAVTKFDGFLRAYQESRDEDASTAKAEEAESDEQRQLPRLHEGDAVELLDLRSEQKFTQPPARYSEATLVKALEEEGIGRPSTYAQILTVIQKVYVTKEEGRFFPSETGIVVADLLVKHFEEIFKYEYTAHLETLLDDIEDGKEAWTHTLQEFYKEFARELDKAKSEMVDLKRQEIETDEICEKCGGKMVIKWGRFGRFMACANYPECKNTREIAREGAPEGAPAETPIEETCEKCGKPMVLKRGRFGEFLACSGYPECRNTKKIVSRGGEREVKSDIPTDEICPQCGKILVIKHGRYGEFTACSNYPECKYVKQITTGVACPEPGCGGEIVQKKSKRGKIFYSCNRYPDCKFFLWYKPLAIPCPKCGASFVLEKTTKREGTVRYCHNKECDYKVAVD